MKIIQENEYLDTMKNEVEPYLKVHCREGYIPGAEDIYHGKNGITGKIHVCCQKWKIKTIITLTARIPSRTSMCLQSILLFSAVTIIVLTVLFCAELCRKTFSACFIISNAVFNSQVLCCGNNMRSEKWIKAAAAKTEAMHLPVRGG